MANTSTTNPSFQVMAAMRRALRILRRSSLLSALVIGVVGFVSVGGGLALASFAISERQAQQTTVVFGPETYWILIPPALAWFLLISLAHTLAAHAAARDLQSRRIGLADSWAACWRHWLPVSAILIVVTLLAALGIILLALPGVAVLLVFALAAPSRVIDGVPLRKTFEHSLRSVVGGGWPLVGYLFVATGMVILLFSGLYWALTELSWALMLAQADRAGGAFQYGAFYVTALILQMALIALAPLVLGVISAAAYAELKAGRGEEALSDVFD